MCKVWLILVFQVSLKTLVLPITRLPDFLVRRTNPSNSCKSGNPGSVNNQVYQGLTRLLSLQEPDLPDLNPISKKPG